MQLAYQLQDDGTKCLQTSGTLRPGADAAIQLDRTSFHIPRLARLTRAALIGIKFLAMRRMSS